MESRGHKTRAAPVPVKHRTQLRVDAIRAEGAGSLGHIRAVARALFQAPAWRSTPAQHCLRLCVLRWVFPGLPRTPSPWCSHLCSGPPRCTQRSPGHCRPCWRSRLPTQLGLLEPRDSPCSAQASPAAGSLSPSWARTNHTLLLRDLLALCRDPEHSRSGCLPPSTTS